MATILIKTQSAMLINELCLIQVDIICEIPQAFIKTEWFSINEFKFLKTTFHL